MDSIVLSSDEYQIRNDERENQNEGVNGVRSDQKALPSQ